MLTRLIALLVLCGVPGVLAQDAATPVSYTFGLEHVAIHGCITGIVDGDTINVRILGKQQIRVRIAFFENGNGDSDSVTIKASAETVELSSPSLLNGKSPLEKVRLRLTGSQISEYEFLDVLKFSRLPEAQNVSDLKQVPDRLLVMALEGWSTVAEITHELRERNGIELRLNRHDGRCLIYLEPEVVEALITFWRAESL